MGRAFELVGELAPPARPPAAVGEPVLMCARQERPTRHVYVGERPVLLAFAETLHAQMYRCAECGEVRQWGLE